MICTDRSLPSFFLSLEGEASIKPLHGNIFDLNCKTKCNYFYPSEVVGRGSETQLQVG